jgi:GntR family transcriptional regulator, transcriptional repressor for pyruvate dehydrogenase complex
MSKVSLDAIAPIRVRSVAEHVVEQLEKLIGDETFPPGEKLPAEHDLADALQVGRSTVREAKQILLAKGLLVSRGRAGTFVASTKDTDDASEVLRALRDPAHQDITEVREVIEIATIRLASARATAADIAEMRAIIDDLAQLFTAQDTVAWSRSLDIHRAIARASKNRVLASIYDLIAQVLARTQVPYLPYIAEGHEEVAQHSRLVDIVAAGDADAAEAEMRLHLRHSDQYRSDLLRLDNLDRLPRRDRRGDRNRP